MRFVCCDVIEETRAVILLSVAYDYVKQSPS